MFGKNLQQSIADQSLNRKKFLFASHRQPYFWNDIPQKYSDELIISSKWYHEEHIVNNSIARKDTPPAMSSIFKRVFLRFCSRNWISYPIIINKSPFLKCYHHSLGIDKMLQLAIKTFIHYMLNGHNTTTCDKRMSMEKQY